MAFTLIKQPGDVEYSKNPVVFKWSNTVRTYLDIYIEQYLYLNSFTKIATLDALPDSSGNVTFQIEELLDSYLAHDMPAYQQSNITKATYVMRRYFVVVRYGTSYSLMYPKKKIIKGGINFQSYPTAGFFTDYLTNNKIFLTWDKTRKTTTAAQQYLYWIASDNFITGIKIKCKIYFTDGTSTDPINILQYNSIVYEYDILIIPAGYTELNLSSYLGGKTIDYYQMWVDDVDEESGSGSGLNNASETITMQMDYKYQRNRRYFYYTNSLGGIEYLCTVGIAEDEYAVESERAYRTIPYDYSVVNGQFFDYNKLETLTKTVNTGFKTKAQLDKLRDFLLAGKIYEVVNDQFLQVVVDKNSIIIKDNDNLNFLQFKYQWNFNNTTYTAEQIREITAGVGVFSAEFNEIYQ